MSNNTYQKIPQLIQDIAISATALEQGQLTLEQLTEMLEKSRLLNERIAILRYQAAGSKGTSISQDKPEAKPEEKEEVPAITKEQLFNEIATNQPNGKKETPAGSFSLNFNVAPQETQEEIKKSPEATPSINQKLAETKQQSVAEKLKRSKIEDLRNVIGINQKFLFMNDLFEGEKLHYDQTIDYINNLSEKQAVETYLNQEIAARFHWNANHPTVKAFKEIVDRKFA